MNLIHLQGHIPKPILDLLPSAFNKYDITTATRAAHFLGQVSHESGGFTTKAESLYYNYAQHIIDTWQSRFNLDGCCGKLNAHNYVANPVSLANAVYDNRMGNAPNSNDGYIYRGGGFIQLTGRDTYTRYALHINTSTDNAAHLVQNDNGYALDSALWMWSNQFNLNPIADEGINDAVITHIRKVINGGAIGLDDVIKEVNHFYSLMLQP